MTDGQNRSLQTKGDYMRIFFNVKAIGVPLFLFMLSPTFSAADVIILKNGNRVETVEAWEENGQIKCYRYGGEVAYPKETVERVEKADPDRREKVGRQALYSSLKQRILAKTRVLHDELMGFKDDPLFHRAGFSADHKYRVWKIRVENLRDDPNSKLLLQDGIAVGDLLMLGFEYMKSKGRETEHTKSINAELTKAFP